MNNTVSWESYPEQMMRNLRAMSRTANGIVDVSASETKKDYMLIGSGDEAKDLTHRNIESALRFVYDHRDDHFDSTDALDGFISNIALMVTDGVVAKDNLFRQGSDSDIPYARIKDIPYFYDLFINRLWELLNSDSNAIEIACYCEFMIQLIGHYFSDGCSKTSMLVAAFILMRYGMPLPDYPDREAFFKAVEELHRPIPTPETFPNEPIYQGFLAFYRTLF